MVPSTRSKSQRAIRFLCGLAPLRAKRKKKREARDKKQDPIAVRFLCVSAPLRAKRRKSREARSKVQFNDSLLQHSALGVRHSTLNKYQEIQWK